MKKIISFFVILGIFIPLAFKISAAPLPMPENFEDIQKAGEKVLDTTKKEAPNVFEKIWNNEVLPVWEKMKNWFLEKVWSKIFPKAKEEVEKRKPVVQEEFEKEKQEMGQEIKTTLPGVLKNIWRKIIDFFK